MSAKLAALAVAAVVAWPGRAAAEPRVTGLGKARAIPRSASASRDTPAMTLVALPRDIRTAGGELALATIRFEGWTVRAGFAGFVELESDGETDGVDNLFPRARGAILWRGSYAYVAAVALDDLGARLCATCAIELTAAYRHESQHYTGSNEGGSGEDVSREPYVGDGAIVDAAVSAGRGNWYGLARVVGLAYLPGRSSYAAGAGIDLHGRWRGWGTAQPFASGYAEYQLGTELEGRRFPDSYLVRGMAGVALASSLGDILVFGFGDVGHRKGIRGLTEEATAGLGIRLAL